MPNWKRFLRPDCEGKGTNVVNASWSFAQSVERD
jgi:hypothetical protein